MVGVLGEDGRPCRRIQLFPVDAEASQVGPDQDAPQGRGTPAATPCCWDIARVQFPTQRGKGLTSKGAAGQLLLLAADPPGDVVGLLGVDGGQNPSAERVIGVTDVDLARDGGDVPGASAVADL